VSAHFTWAPGALDKQQACYYINVSPRKFDEITGRGDIVAKKLDGKKVYLRDELDSLLAGLPEWATS
jgi:hypothetical protein